MELTIRQSDVSDFFQILKCLKDLTCAISKAWDSRISNMAFPGAMKVMKHDTLSNIMLERPGVLWKPLLDEKSSKLLAFQENVVCFNVVVGKRLISSALEGQALARHILHNSYSTLNLMHCSSQVYLQESWWDSDGLSNLYICLTNQQHNVC